MAISGWILLALSFFLLIPSFAHASIVLNFRKAISQTNNNSSAAANLTQNSPIPVSGGKESNSTAVKHEKDNNLNSTAVRHEKEKTFNSTIGKHENDKYLNTTAAKPVQDKNSNSTTPKHQKEKPTDTGVTRNDTGSSKSVPTNTGQPEGQGKRGGTDSQLGSDVSCAGSTKNCSILNTMVACVLPSEPGSKELSILVQSLSKRTLKVNFVGNALRPFEISSHQTIKMKISLAEVKANTIVLHAENGECAIHMAPPPGKNYFEELSFYSKQVTPIYGAYFSFLVVLVCGGVWACCKLRKRRWQGGVPYQELEMGLPESAAAASVNVNSTEGWDQGWDSDWDDDKAVMSPGGNHVGSISANGLTSRSAKKDGWDVDWED
ncbi:Dentin sialophosphoprotein-like protein [Heracleum sosnowskyi]|uniref:Dentin sialophosphoprotein-like protein n=1 Tax=Heracleum sosnowskyi TaxID=360622 RepID=A0AAD8LX70_9APIA|nr:Dentin sialophosphoprotein-like protein [Heracleum sosnowskyi]